MSRAASAGAVVHGASRLSGLFLTGGLIAAIVYITVPTLAPAAFAAVGLGSAAAIYYGIRRYHPLPRWPWGCLSAACLVFLIGAIVRAGAEGAGGLALFLSDMFTIPGYALMFIGFLGFLRARTGIKRHAVIDGLLVGIGAAIIFAILFAVPAATIAGRPPALSALAGIYPLLDGVLILLVLNLAFTTSQRGPSYFMLIGCMVLMLIGDIAYAFIGAAGQLVGSPLLDLPFLLGFTLIGASALHPSMVQIVRTASLPVQAWSVRRLLLIAPALAVPFVFNIVIARPSLLDRVVVAAGGAIIVTLLLVRAVSAVQGYAAAQARYEYQATHDPLTGLANRSLWFTKVRGMLETTTRETPVWVYFLDLDGFKLVNDSRGHMAGDQVIAEVARRLRLCAPEEVAIARIGGDEFVLAYRATDEDAIRLAELVGMTMRQTLKMPTTDVVISASIGIASSANAIGTTAEDLLRDADTAMYQAKAAGRDSWVIFDPSMRDRVQERIETDLALREALAANQFQLAFQPVIHLATNRIVGAEALIRWNHPARGPVGPSSFIPIAEESGLIIDIGRWVMHESLRQLAAWREAGVVDDEFWLSINVSPRQLRDPRLPHEVASALAEYRLPGSMIVIELTESVMMDATPGTNEALTTLRKLGVGLVVDDFGTGFSALGYLRTYPVTGVKVDRSFVAGLGANPEDEAIVKAVVAMSTALHLSIVAEGVQTQAQRAVLDELGVIYGQGWLWSEAVDANTFERVWRPAASLAYPR